MHRPAGPQAAARPAGKTPLPPPGAGPKRAADGTAVAGGKPGPKPFVVKPHAGKAITIKPREEPPAESGPVGGKPVAAPAKREAPKPAAKKPVDAAKPPSPVKKPAPAAPRKPAAPHKPANGGKTPAAKSAGASKTPGRTHSAQLKKSKPR